MMRRQPSETVLTFCGDGLDLDLCLCASGR